MPKSHKRHLVRLTSKSPYRTACGMNQSNVLITLTPKEITCQSCLRCMTEKEVKMFLGGSNG